MDNNEQTPLVDHGRIAASTKLAYALGHVFNDLAAATWFSYTLIYLQRVALLEPIVAGAFLLLGKHRIIKFADSLIRRFDLRLKEFSFKDKSSTRS